MSAPLLSIQKLTQANMPFPAYFVVSTAPINIEDNNAEDITDPTSLINEISQHLNEHKDKAEVLIVVHGYNTSKADTEDWYRSIYKHLTEHYNKSRSEGLLLIGYRWPSEKVLPKSSEGGSCQNKSQSSTKVILGKFQAAMQALPVILGLGSRWGTIGVIGGLIASVVSIIAIAWQASKAGIFLIIFSTLTILSLITVSAIFTILALRLVVYFRDTYRANNFGVSDLVELIRQIDNTVVKASPDQKRSETDRIKLSFIGHSMGGFVVTNTVRILSDVFDSSSIGSLDITKAEKKPSSFIGNVFSLERLVLVSPDIPAETIISQRANFLQSSLRRFKEAYLFSNEGDMALRLASPIANYFIYPSNRQVGGYRLGNVMVRNFTEKDSNGNLVKKTALQKGSPIPSGSYGMIVRLPDENEPLVSLQNGQNVLLSNREHLTYPLDYVYIQDQLPLSTRQKEIALAPNQKPIGEFFTFFDCTDYTEKYLDKGRQKSAGLVSHALRKQALSFKDFVRLTIDYFRGRIDTHGGYFCDGETNPKKGLKPEATFTKFAIYGLACVGFERLLIELQEEPIFSKYTTSYEQILKNLESQPAFLSLTDNQKEKVISSHLLSSICRDKGIQVLLSQERYALDVSIFKRSPNL